MVKTNLSHRTQGSERSLRRRVEQEPRFAQSELWESLEPPVETTDAIRTLAALRERFEQALEREHDRVRAAS